MKRLSLAMLLGILGILISDGGGASAPATVPPDQPASPPATQPGSFRWRRGDAVIFLAQYTDGGGSYRTSARIQGRNFNASAISEGDCQESADGQNWSRCAMLRFTSNVEYDVMLNHPASWPRVYVKVLGDDGIYSLPVIVSK